METFDEDKVLLIEIGQPEMNGHVKAVQNIPLRCGVARPVAKVPAEQVMRLITGRNVELLQIIKQRQPQSLAELSRMSGRPTASLTRTLQRLMALGIVVLRKSKGREKIPVVVCDCLRFELPLTASIVTEL